MSTISRFLIWNIQIWDQIILSWICMSGFLQVVQNFVTSNLHPLDASSPCDHCSKRCSLRALNVSWEQNLHNLKPLVYLTCLLHFYLLPVYLLPYKPFSPPTQELSFHFPNHTLLSHGPMWFHVSVHNSFQNYNVLLLIRLTST